MTTIKYKNMSELSKEYFDQQVKRLFTKEDAKNFATKDDLLDFAKNSEVKALRVDVLGVKDEIKEIRKDLNAYAKSIVRHDRQISVLTNDVKRLKMAVKIK